MHYLKIKVVVVRTYYTKTHREEEAEEMFVNSVALLLSCDLFPWRPVDYAAETLSGSQPVTL